MNDEVLAERREAGIFLIRLNRPARKHALTEAMYVELTRLLDEASRDTAVRVLMIAGDAESFCAGNDLEDFVLHPPRDEDSPVFRFLRALNRLEKPLIAVVNGHAVGIGTTLLLHCDLAYASAGARFKLPFVSLGCCPEGGSSLLLPRTLGQRQAAELLLLGETFGAEKARELGLINAVTGAPDAFAEALDAARRLAMQPPAALRLTKRMMKAANAETLDEVLVEEARRFCACLQGEEAAEALQAFVEKRSPDFSRFV
ncbi:enoyl-CoA hydratase [Marinobacterium aestuariivivens]|uniref:Enoyl-CoA hydratase n=1 Tax=Marinobacterium aestuariivivens TaxID=1698799 RepID=A0ABW2A3P3_9GAMM